MDGTACTNHTEVNEHAGADYPHTGDVCQDAAGKQQIKRSPDPEASSPSLSGSPPESHVDQVEAKGKRLSVHRRNSQEARSHFDISNHHARSDGENYANERTNFDETNPAVTDNNVGEPLDGEATSYQFPHMDVEPTDEIGSYTHYSGSIAGSEEGDDMIVDVRNEEKQRIEIYANEDDFKYLENEYADELDPKKPWVPPTAEKANEHASAQKFEKGKAPIVATRIREISHLGAGVGLYFKLRANVQMHLSCVFFLMTIASIPSYLLMNAGSRLPEGERGLLDLGKISLGNLGHSDQHMNEFDKEQCEEESGEGCESGGTIRIAGLNTSYTLMEMSMRVTIIDLIASAIFLLFIVCIKNIFNKELEIIQRVSVSAADYTVMVTGFPPTTKRENLRAHFDSLYNLFQEGPGQPTCCGSKPPRPALKEESDEVLRQMLMRRRGTDLGDNPNYRRETASCVETTYHTDLKEVAGGFVADVQMAYRIGEQIRKFKKIEHLAYKMKLAMSLYRKVPQVDKIKYAYKASKAQESLQALQRQAVSNTSSESVAAFVTFNNEESFRRCVEDYKSSNSVIWRMFQPRHLRLYQDPKIPLRVQPAVQPGNIIWENVETTRTKRFLRELVSLILVVSLLIISFSVNLGLNAAQQNFQDVLPSSGLCNRALPTLYYGRTTDLPPKSRLQRFPDLASTTCGEDEDYFYLTYACTVGNQKAVYEECLEHLQGDNDRQLIEQMKTQNSNGVNSTEACTNPCFKKNSNDKTQCKVSLRDGDVSFRRGMIPLCYCQRRMSELIDQKGVFFYSELRSQESGVCDEFLSMMIREQVLVLVVTFVVVIVNAALSTALKASARFERHWTVSSELKAQVTKIVTAQVINMSVVIIIVNAKIEGGIGILSGEFSSFEYRWYVAVGVPIVLTMIMDSMFSNGKTIAQALVVFPLRRWWVGKTTHSQARLGKAYTAPPFDLSNSYASLTTSVMVTMVFSTGMPLLLPIACFAHLLGFWIDKWALLRIYSKPPAFDQHVAQMTLKLLPVALTLHYLIGFWMMGDDDIASDNVLTILLESGRRTGYDEVDDAADDGRMDEATQLYFERFKNRVGSWEKVGLLPRLVKASALPLFAGFLTMMAYYVFKFFGVWPLIRWPLSKAFNIMVCGKYSIRKARADNLRPTFTGLYYKPLLPIESNHLTRKEEARGWLLMEDPFRGERTMMKIRLWMDDGTFCNKQHGMGERMLTYEAINQYQIFSYDIRKNPRYETIVTPMLSDSNELEKEQERVRRKMEEVMNSDIQRILDAGENKCCRRLYYIRVGLKKQHRVVPLESVSSHAQEEKQQQGLKDGIGSFEEGAKTQFTSNPDSK